MTGDVAGQESVYSVQNTTSYKDILPWLYHPLFQFVEMLPLVALKYYILQNYDIRFSIGMISFIKSMHPLLLLICRLQGGLRSV